MLLCIALVDEVLERCVKRVHQFRIQVLDVKKPGTARRQTGLLKRGITRN